MKKIIALILAFVMCLGLVACGNSETPDVSDSSEQQTSAEESSAPEEPEADSHYPVTITNVNYNKEPVEYTYEKAPERVITIRTNSLETMLALGLGDRVIMTVVKHEDDILPELRDEYDRVKENFASNSQLADSGATLSKETAIMLDPDFILGWKSFFSDKLLGDITYWNENGIGTYIALNSNDVSEWRTLENEYTDIINVGKIFDVEDRANEIVDEIKAEVERITSATAGQEKKTVLVFEFLGDGIWNYDETMLAGDMVKAMGGNLLAAPSDLGKEDILNLDPDVIFVINNNQDDVAKVMDDPSFSSLKAVQNGDVYSLPLTYVYTSGVRTIYGLNTIGAALYPDLYSEE